ncbi:MAG: hypothetical protein IKN41_00660 [Candidatus Methanomethylophilaceae archaeon]|nr:hypothetical protein [Candidatus Methanomethylophilaceae archaeon]MBR6910352.1 hypothetical protein [Candidatus Methanomethylophilaceae archaeon]
MLNGTLEDRKKFLTLVSVMATICVLVIVSVVILAVSSNETVITHDYEVSYNPNGATKDNGGDATVIVAEYDGIISTEYNPEHWNDGLTKSTPGNLPDDVPNWVGPQSSVVATAVIKMTVSTGTSYTLNYPSGCTLSSPSVISGGSATLSASGNVLTASSFSKSGDFEISIDIT